MGSAVDESRAVLSGARMCFWTATEFSITRHGSPCPPMSVEAMAIFPTSTRRGLLLQLPAYDLLLSVRVGDRWRDI